ncbi:MAG: hypothetical protein HYY06_02630 [Deltaproteobacteria bacterium]|nr:hypothetical protein [Deltaproteobacteria bacterium]
MRAALLVAAVLVSAAPCEAQPVVSAYPAGRLPSPVDRSPRPDPWYGETILAVDAPSITAMVLAGFVLDRDDPDGVRPLVGLAGLAGYLLGGFTIHWGHGRIGLAFLDLAGRIIGPYTAGLIAWRADGAKDESQVAEAAMIGGLAIASFIDAFVLARKAPEPRRVDERATAVPLGRPLRPGSAAQVDEDD